MSKPIKNLITKSYQSRFGRVEGAVLVDVRGVKSNLANQLRAGLARNQIKVTVVKNSLARKALAGTALENLGPLMEGPSALVYGSDSVVSVARRLLELAKDIEGMQFKGAILEGQVYGPDQVQALSKFPTRQEAQAQAISLILSPGRKLAGQIAAPGSKIAALVKAIADKKEKEAPAAAA